jgi:hypothetical protein
MIANNQINVTLCLSTFTAANVVHVMDRDSQNIFETVVENDSLQKYTPFP